jgi:hypothetical protein
MTNCKNPHSWNVLCSIESINSPVNFLGHSDERILTFKIYDLIVFVKFQMKKFYIIKSHLKLISGSSMKQIDPTEFYDYAENYPGVWNIYNISQQRPRRKSS